MKRRYSFMIYIFCLLSLFFLWSCGSGPGSPGSEGSEDTGVKLEATVVGFYNNTVGLYSVDAFQDVCDVGPPPVFEIFTDHQATATINARLLNPNAEIPPGNLYIDKYTVVFKRSTDSIGAPPIESDTRFTSIIITPPTGTGTSTVTANLILVDIIRKIKYQDDVLSGQFSSGPAHINNYTAIFTFEGKNENGERFSLKAQMDFAIGNFDYCA